MLTSLNQPPVLSTFYKSLWVEVCKFEVVEVVLPYLLKYL